MPDGSQRIHVPVRIPQGAGERLVELALNTNASAEILKVPART